MPTYDYVCDNCNTGETRRDIPVNERNQQWCHTCYEPLTRLIDAPAIHFKGSGFYVNDYKRKP